MATQTETWAEWRDRRETYAQKRRSELDDAVLYFLVNADDPMTEREIGAELGMDLTTVYNVTRRLQKRGDLRCEMRYVGPWRHGQKQGLRRAWVYEGGGHVHNPLP